MGEYLYRSVRGDFARACAAAVFIGIACYNSVELIILCFITFKRYSGMYFWSLLVSSICIIPFALGYLLFIFEIYRGYFAVTLVTVGWWGMVTGQSLVLWSRLHLLVHNRMVMRGTLGMIIINAIIFHIPGSVLEFGALNTKGGNFSRGFDIFERIQLVAFSAQEILLSTMYAWEVTKLLNLRPRGHYKRTLTYLLVVNLLLILMDAAIIAIEYSDYFLMQVTVKAMIYSVKLKLEYAILGKLVGLLPMPSSTSAAVTDQPDFIDPLSHELQTAEQHHRNRESLTSVTGNGLEGSLPEHISNSEMEEIRQ